MPQPQPVITIDIASKEDFPNATDSLAVINATIDILKNLDRNSSERHHATTVWKFSGASMESPLHLEVSGSQKVQDNRTRVIRAYIDGFRAIASESPPTEFPPHFDEPTLRRAKGLVGVLRRDISRITFSSPGMESVTPTLRVEVNIDGLIGPKYQAKGALEGVLQTLSVHKRNSFNIYDPLTDAKVTCYFGKEKMEQARAAFDHRVAVYGDIRYNKHGKAITLEVEDIRQLRSRADLPQARDIDIDVTGGVDPSDYIRRLRDAE